LEYCIVLLNNPVKEVNKIESVGEKRHSKRCHTFMSYLSACFRRDINRLVTMAILPHFASRFDMVCIAAKCSNECQACKECHYAIEQMSALAQGEPTSGLCPKLESCVQSCLQVVSQSFSSRFPIIACVARRCNVHCYDGDCSSCRTISKRMFTIICQQTDMPKLPHIQYTGTCPHLFNELADDYVAGRKRIVA
uniref:DB domain-containing protein n=1 Tax=Angiostrongylus cantonensis TaxID=6313 RepID=A0A0K0DKE1_ANGCA